MADSLSVEELSGFGLATIMARRGVSYARIGEALSLDAPDRPAMSGDAALALVGTGPGAWLAVAETADGGFADALRARLTSLASVSDQSGGYRIFRLAGAGARTLLQRGAHVDLHPAVFGTGCAATTVIAHIGVIFWQRDDLPTYDLAIFRSYYESFRSWISESSVALDY